MLGAFPPQAVDGFGHQTPTPGIDAHEVVGKSTPPSVKQLMCFGGVLSGGI